MTESVDKMGFVLVTQLEAFLTSLYNEPVTLKIHFRSRIITNHLIKSLVCSVYKLDWWQLVQDSRKNEFLFPRMIFIYLCKVYTALTEDQIAAIVTRDRTTVIANIKRMEELIAVKDDCIYPKLKSIIDQLNAIQNDAPSNEIATPGN